MDLNKYNTILDDVNFHGWTWTCFLGYKKKRCLIFTWNGCRYYDKNRKKGFEKGYKIIFISKKRQKKLQN